MGNSNCRAFFDGRINGIIHPGDWIDCGNPSPPILPIVINRVIINNIAVYEIFVGATDIINGLPNAPSAEITFAVTFEVNSFLNNTNATVTAFTPGTLISMKSKLSAQSGSTNLSFSFTLQEGCPVPADKFKIGDQYLFNFDFAMVSSFSIEFTRDNRLNTDTNGQMTPMLSSIKIPQIFISSQTLVDASDIGSTTFQIKDEFQYYSHKPLISTCGNFSTNKIKITDFSKCCPKIVSVLKGKGFTASDKIVYLFNNEQTNTANQFIFADNIINYSMLKYLLSRILYGNFNIDHLLGKYNSKFLEDLGNSRFCNFLDSFINPNSIIFGYNQYFLFK